MTTLEEKNLNIDNSVAKIKVLGVGGGGSNAVKRMYKNKSAWCWGRRLKCSEKNV